MLKEAPRSAEMKLSPEHPLFGKTIANIGGGPAGAFMAYLLARERVDVHIFEPRTPRNIQLDNGEAPTICSGCAGLLQNGAVALLKDNNLLIPPSVIQSQPQTTTIMFPDCESGLPLSIPQLTVYRGTSPIKLVEGQPRIESFDAWLLDEAIRAGAKYHGVKIEAIDLHEGKDNKVSLKPEDQDPFPADLIIGAFGHSPRLMGAIIYPDTAPVALEIPESQKAGVREYFVPPKLLSPDFYNSAYVFANPTTNVLFGAIYPKGNINQSQRGMYLTIALMGRGEITADDFTEFLTNPQVQSLIGLTPETAPNCACRTSLTLKSPKRFIFPSEDAERMIMINIGDSGPTRPRKNGIGAALDSAKHLSQTLLKYGNSVKAMREYQRHINRTYVWDNYAVDMVMQLADLVINHSFPRQAVIYLNSHSEWGMLSRAVRSTIEHILTGKSPYWRIPFDVARETFAPSSAPGAEGY